MGTEHVIDGHKLLVFFRVFRLNLIKSWKLGFAGGRKSELRFNDAGFMVRDGCIASVGMSAIIAVRGNEGSKFQMHSLIKQAKGTRRPRMTQLDIWSEEYQMDGDNM